jgi:hypothetical protein
MKKEKLRSDSDFGMFILRDDIPSSRLHRRRITKEVGAIESGLLEVEIAFLEAILSPDMEASKLSYDEVYGFALEAYTHELKRAVNLHKPQYTLWYNKYFSDKYKSVR